jgi:hypothetical protein
MDEFATPYRNDSLTDSLTDFEISPPKDQLNIDTVMPKVDEEDEESDNESHTPGKKVKKSSKKVIMLIESKKASGVDMVS